MDAVVLGHYFVEKDGRVLSLRSGRYLKGGMGTNGRPFVILSVDSQRALKYRHILVAETYLGECPPGKEVSHLDGNILNNHVSNLKYETRAENLARRRAHGTMDDGFNNSRAVLKPGDPEKIKELRSSGMTHSKIATEFGVSRTTISRVLNGHRYGGTDEDD